MTRAKRILTIIAAVIIGTRLAYTGATELANSIQLRQRGKSTTAEVISGRERVSGRLRRHSYYLSVVFRDDSGQSVRREIRVSEATFRAGRASEATKVFYLPEASAICAAGDTVEMRYESLLCGLLLLGAGLFLVCTFNAPSNIEKLAARVEEKLKPMMEPRHEYATAQSGDFKHLDLAFYDAGQRFFEGKGYQFVGDRENVTLRIASGTRTLLRLLLSGDQTTQAFLYHFQVSATKEAKVTDLQTSFSNGSFVSTSNAKAAGKFESPPSVLALFLPDVTWETVLETHQLGRVSEYLDLNPGVSPATINGAGEFQSVMDALQKIKADFRRQQGISQSELERISGKTGPQIQELAETLRQRWTGKNPHAQTVG